MAEFLGKPKVKLEEIAESFRIRPMTSQYYINEKKARLMLTMDYDLSDKFFAAVTKKFGRVNIFTVEKAAKEAVEKWIKEVK
jgi:hypothetical protein